MLKNTVYLLLLKGLGGVYVPDLLQTLKRPRPVFHSCTYSRPWSLHQMAFCRKQRTFEISIKSIRHRPGSKLTLGRTP